MSGNKCTQVELEAERAAELREKQERQRRAREAAERARLVALQKKADTKIATLANATEAADASFLNQWTGNAFNKLKEDLSALKGSSEKNPEKADLAVDALDQRLQSLRAQANAAHDRDEARKEVVGTLRTVLTADGYLFTARLADSRNPLSDVVIQAEHPSTKHVELQVDLAMANVRMNLDDDRITGSNNGADCAKDLESMITALAKGGVNMTRTDTGPKATGPKPPRPTERSLPASAEKKNESNA